MLPEEVLKKAQEEMLEYGESGMSVMEMSHRSKDFQNIIDEAEKLVRELMNVPENYKVMFLQGGGSTQFAMVPLNLASKHKAADYIITGQWAKKAASEAEKFIKVNRVALRQTRHFRTFPSRARRLFRVRTRLIIAIYATIIRFTERDIQSCPKRTLHLLRIFRQMQCRK